MDDHQLVILRYYSISTEAHFARAVLESKGIDVYLRDEHTIGLNPMFNVLLGGIKLQVPQPDMEEALAILRDMEHAPSTNDDGIAHKCPKCGSEDVQGGYSTIRTWRGLFSMIIAWATGTLPLNTDSVYRCDACGARFVPTGNAQA